MLNPIKKLAIVVFSPLLMAVVVGPKNCSNPLPLMPQKTQSQPLPAVQTPTQPTDQPMDQPIDANKPLVASSNPQTVDQAAPAEEKQGDNTLLGSPKPQEPAVEEVKGPIAANDPVPSDIAHKPQLKIDDKEDKKKKPSFAKRILDRINPVRKFSKLSKWLKGN